MTQPTPLTEQPQPSKTPTATVQDAGSGNRFPEISCCKVAHTNGLICDFNPYTIFVVDI